MMNLVKVVSVEHAGAAKLRIRFSDGSAGTHDFAAMIAEPGEMSEPLRDPAFFNRVFIEMGVLTWPNGFDLDAINLHMQMAAAGELAREAAE